MYFISRIIIFWNTGINLYAFLATPTKRIEIYNSLLKSEEDDTLEKYDNRDE